MGTLERKHSARGGERDYAERMNVVLNTVSTAALGALPCLGSRSDEGVVIEPDWPVPARVHALMSTRMGGCSAPPWDSLNLGAHVGDVSEHVAHNRTRWQKVLGRRPVYLSQVHGTESVTLTHDSADGLQADVCECIDNAVAATVMVADCMPVLMSDARGQWVSAGHAGWRGLAGRDGHGVLEVMVQLAAQRGVASQDLRVWLGPCIGPQTFEVGDEVRQAFMRQHQQAGAFFVAAGDQGKWLAHLPGLARLRLQLLGVDAVYGNDGAQAWCTVAQSSLFFSHRRDSQRLGGSGRMAASIWLE